MVTLTLLLSRSPLSAGWQESITAHLGEEWQANLFFLDQGVFLVGESWPCLAQGGEAIYCASGHTRLRGPAPSPTTLPGGLANLGAMIRDSAYTLSLPNLHWPNQMANIASKKRIGILLDDHPERVLEA
ncbi:MAG: hypothetical protein HQL94_07040, partial [Magnetococcales bacterium]|nr:hypothetical protein [Magnetococcales bacterium]